MTKCDFCSNPAPEFRLEAESFLIPGAPGHGSLSDWLACAHCAALIQADDWPGLLERAARALAIRRNWPVKRLRDQIRPVYEELRRHAGELTRIEGQG